MSNSLVLKLKDQFTSGMAGATTSLNRSVKSASTSAKAFNSAFKEGERITKALRSPTEIYNDQIRKLTQYLNLGAISHETFNRGVAKAKTELSSANIALNSMNKTVNSSRMGIDALGASYQAVIHLFGCKDCKVPV